MAAVVRALYKDRSSDGYTTSLNVSVSVVDDASVKNLFALAFANGDSLVERIRTGSVYSNQFANGPFDVALSKLLNQPQFFSPSLYVPVASFDTVFLQLARYVSLDNISMGSLGVEYLIETT